MGTRLPTIYLDRFGLAVAMFCVVAACKDEAPVDSTIAEAVKTESKTEKAAAELAARQKAQREQEEAKRRALEERRQSEIEAAANLPDPLPDDLGAACDVLVQAYDAFMKAGGEADVLRWHDGRRKKLGERRARCVKARSVELAACGAHALGQPLQSLTDLPRNEAARRVLDACSQKYPPPGSADGGS